MYYWYHLYLTMLVRWWQHMTPTKYGYLLCSIGFVGWLLMKGSKR